MYVCSYFFAVDNLDEIARHIHIENNDWQIIFHAHCGGSEAITLSPRL